MEPGTIVIYLISAVVSLVILYFIIKAAVRNGYIEAKRDILAVEKRAAAKAEEAGLAKKAESGEVW